MRTKTSNKRAVKRVIDILECFSNEQFELLREKVEGLRGLWVVRC